MACNCMESEWSGKVSRQWLLGFMPLHIVCLWAFYQDHKSTLCEVACGGEGGAFFGAPRCNCFFLQLP